MIQLSCFLAFSFLFATGFGHGDGSSTHPYQIATADELALIENDLAAHYIITAPIDLGLLTDAGGWLPLGTFERPFTGSLDGNGYTITGLKIDQPDAKTPQGLFAYNAGTLQNVRLEGVDVRGGDRTGGLVGWNAGTISHSSVTGVVEGNSDVGGLIGHQADGTVRDSSFAGNVTGTENVGGLVGFAGEGVIQSSVADTVVDGERNVGGLVGHNGVLGDISSSIALGEVFVSDATGGGLAGYNEGVIKESHAAGKVEGGSYVGGFVGQNALRGSIENSYAKGSVFGAAMVGGFAGQNLQADITNSYAAAESVHGDTIWTGGFIGSSFLGVVEGNYWRLAADIQFAGSGAPQDHEGTTGLTDEEMRQSESFVGWDFERIWGMQEGQTFPYLGAPGVVPAKEEEDPGQSKRKRRRTPSPVDDDQLRSDDSEVSKSKGEGALPECAWDVRDSSGNEVKSEQLQTKRVNIDELPDLSDFTLLTGYGCVIETKQADGLTYSSFDRPIIVTLPGEMIDSSFDNERNAAFMFYWDELRGQWLALPTRFHANGDVSAFLERPALVAFLSAEHVFPLNDLPGHWAEADILKLISMHIVRGVPSGYFLPDRAITRAEFIKMLVHAVRLPVATTNRTLFADDDAIPEWARAEVEAAYRSGIVRGFGGNRFGPDELITREQMAVFFVRAFSIRQESSGRTQFPNEADISDWARASVQVAVQYGLLNGHPDGRLAPQETATRAQAASLVWRALVMAVSQPE